MKNIKVEVLGSDQVGSVLTSSYKVVENEVRYKAIKKTISTLLSNIDNNNFHPWLEEKVANIIDRIIEDPSKNSSFSFGSFVCTLSS